MSVFRMLAAVVALAAASPVVAQVPSTGPYSPVDGNANAMLLVADGTVARRGDIGSATVIAVYSEAGRAESDGVARMDLAYEYRCGGADYRTIGVTTYDVSGALMGSDMTVFDWEPVSEGSPNAVVRAFACDGQRTTDSPAATVEAMQEFYRGWLAGEYD